MKLTAEQMLEKYSNNASHPQEVRRLAMMIFDGVNEYIWKTQHYCMTLVIILIPKVIINIVKR